MYGIFTYIWLIFMVNVRKYNHTWILLVLQKGSEPCTVLVLFPSARKEETSESPFGTPSGQGDVCFWLLLESTEAYVPQGGPKNQL